MYTVYKYTLVEYRPTQVSVMMPEGCEILHFGLSHNGRLCIWAVVDTEIEFVTREFRVYGTGHDMGNLEDLMYIGTTHTPGAIWHLFEVNSPEA